VAAAVFAFIVDLAKVPVSIASASPDERSQIPDSFRTKGSWTLGRVRHEQRPRYGSTSTMSADAFGTRMLEL